jgi:hypothetical protein
MFFSYPIIPEFQTKTAYPSVSAQAKACSAVRRKNPAEQDRPFLREQADKFNEQAFY